MDEAAIDAAGVQPLQPWLDKIAALKSSADLTALLADLHRHGVSALFSIFRHRRRKGFGERHRAILPGRPRAAGPRLLHEDRRGVEEAAGGLRGARRQRRSSSSATRPKPPRRKPKSVLALETELAKASKTRVQLRDPQSNYHKMTLDDLAKTAPGFDWKAYFARGRQTGPGSARRETAGVRGTRGRVGDDTPVADLQVLPALASRPRYRPVVEQAVRGRELRLLRHHADGSKGKPAALETGVALSSTRASARRWASCTWRKLSRRRPRPGP